MVGTVLSRVLSRTKISALSSTETFDEKMDHVHSNPTTSITLDAASNEKTMAKIISYSPRKQSYASVKEDSETPQSFRWRNLFHQSDLPYDLSGTPSDENALDDEDSSVESEDQDVFTESSDPDASSMSSRNSAKLETMPDEILDTIFSFITLDASKDRYVDPKVDLFNLLFVSKAMHAAALRVLYRHVKIPQSKAFFKFHNALVEDPSLGSLVQCLDFSHYSNMGFGRARSTTIVKPYLTPKTLKTCLDRTTNLKAFLVHEHVDDELDEQVLTRLFSIPSLQALDLCACSAKGFVEALPTVCKLLPLTLPNIQRLSLHECTTIRPQVFEALLPRLTRLTHLDVAHTLINDKALMSIPSSARITHLNLERCSQITGSTVAKFLTTHPAARDSMVYLNLLADASRYRLLSEEDLNELLPTLPTTLRSLNLGGARIDSNHTGMLRDLALHLEELGLKGANLSLSEDVYKILTQPKNSENKSASQQSMHNLRYIDLTDIKSVSQMSLTYSPAAITASGTTPLEVIEVGDSVLKDLTKRTKNIKNPEWLVRELGRRGWYVRQAQNTVNDAAIPDDGYRSWKMGARWWGMRKIPVFNQDTGGMYGYFMFKRA